MITEDIFEELYSDNNNYLQVQILNVREGFPEKVSSNIEIVQKDIHNGMYEYNKLNLNR